MLEGTLLKYLEDGSCLLRKERDSLMKRRRQDIETGDLARTANERFALIFAIFALLSLPYN